MNETSIVELSIQAQGFIKEHSKIKESLKKGKEELEDLKNQIKNDSIKLNELNTSMTIADLQKAEELEADINIKNLDAEKLEGIVKRLQIREWYFRQKSGEEK